MFVTTISPWLGIGSLSRTEFASDAPLPWFVTVIVYVFTEPGSDFGLVVPFTGSENVLELFSMTRFTFTSEKTCSSMFQKCAWSWGVFGAPAMCTWPLVAPIVLVE